VLVEGEYNGVLRPGEHFIELRSDLSNLDTVLDQMRDERLRERIVEAAHRDVVGSGRWTYGRFVEDVEHAVFGDRPRTAPATARVRLALALNRILDRIAWREVWARVVVLPRLSPLIGRVPAPARKALKRLLVRPG
jgi:hypothetical protein